MSETSNENTSQGTLRSPVSMPQSTMAMDADWNLKKGQREREREIEEETQWETQNLQEDSGPRRS